MFCINYLKTTFITTKSSITKVLICPDKFKFSLTSSQVAQIIRSHLPAGIESRTITLADGGEGSLDTISTQLPGQWHTCTVLDPLLRSIQASYFSTQDGEAFIEMARASGLGLIAESERNLTKATTYGTGQQILDSLNKKNTRINVLIGGSATNDGGIGCAAALGFSFYDKNSRILNPIAENLINIRSIQHQDNHKMSLIQNAKIAVYTDVTNPLTGPNGASYIYGSQKGGTPKELDLLDQGLINLNTVFKEQYGVDADLIPGSGAAGGLGAGCRVLLKAELLRGIDLIFGVTNFQSALKWADLVITGEGKFDGQTLEGKVVKGVIDRSLVQKKPVVVFCAISQQAEDFNRKYPSVALIELLNAEEKKTIDPTVTQHKLISAVSSLFKDFQ